jgi:[ribosomal protein S5]-alanine N-acetyltransferase
MLRTDRLLIRPFTPADLDDLAALYADPEVMALAGGTCDRATAERCLHRYAAETPLNYQAIVERATGAFVGEVGLPRFRDEVEIGWTLVRAAWGNGYATEAARPVLEQGLGELGLDHVIATILPENAASIRVAEKLGMRRDGWMERDGKPHLRFVAP